MKTIFCLKNMKTDKITNMKIDVNNKTYEYRHKYIPKLYIIKHWEKVLQNLKSLQKSSAAREDTCGNETGQRVNFVDAAATWILEYRKIWGHEF